jgi:hypothetical protein
VTPPRRRGAVKPPPLIGDYKPPGSRRSAPPPRVLAAIALVCSVAAIVATLVAASHSGGPADDSAPARARILAPAISTAGIELHADAPEEWAAGTPPRIPGIAFSTPPKAYTDPLGTRVALGMVPVDSRSMLPQALVDRLPLGPGAPSVVEFGGALRGLHYSMSAVPGVQGTLDVYVAPTDRGAITLVCTQSDPTIPFARCTDFARSITVEGATGLRLGDGSAFGAALEHEASTLDAARERIRDALEHAGAGGQEQIDAANGVAATYRAVADRLGALAGTAAERALVARLSGVTADYRQLEAALRAKDTGAFTAARDAIVAGEAKLGDAFGSELARQRLRGAGGPV